MALRLWWGLLQVRKVSCTQKVFQPHRGPSVGHSVLWAPNEVSLSHPAPLIDPLGQTAKLHLLGVESSPVRTNQTWCPSPSLLLPVLVETCQCWKCVYRWGKLRPKLMETLYLGCDGYLKYYRQFPVSGLSLA